MWRGEYHVMPFVKRMRHQQIRGAFALFTFLIFFFLLPFCVTRIFYHFFDNLSVRLIESHRKHKCERSSAVVSYSYSYSDSCVFHKTVRLTFTNFILRSCFPVDAFQSIQSIIQSNNFVSFNQKSRAMHSYQCYHKSIVYFFWENRYS